MKKLFIAALAVAALAGCKDKGGDFVGQWQFSDARGGETITVTKADGDYRVVSQLDGDKKGYMNVEVILRAESDTLLVRQRDGRRALKMADNGKVTSYLRNKPNDFSKVN